MRLGSALPLAMFFCTKVGGEAAGLLGRAAGTAPGSNEGGFGIEKVFDASVLSGRFRR